MIIKATENAEGRLCANVLEAVSLSVVDGPGSRIVVFFQGCNVGCEWCHSPHLIPLVSPLLYHDDECAKCERCREICPSEVHLFLDNQHQLNRAVCCECGRCIEACPYSSANKESSILYLPSRKVDVSSLMEQLSPYLAISDGITLSGGEALLQTQAAVSLLKLCKERGVHTAVETSGLLNVDCYIAALPYVDIWLFGVRVLTAKNGSYKTAKISEVLECIHSSQSVIIPRIPMIPNVTNKPETLNEIDKLLNNIALDEICLNPWNRFFTHYYNLSGSTLVFPIPTESEITQCEWETENFFRKKGYKLKKNYIQLN